MAERGRDKTSETRGEAPAEASRDRTNSTQNRFDPISVASAALSSREAEPDQKEKGGLLSRFRSRKAPRGTSGGSGDQAGSAEAEGNGASSSSLRERFGHVVDHARAAIKSDQKPGETSEVPAQPAVETQEGSPGPAAGAAQGEPDSEPEAAQNQAPQQEPQEAPQQAPTSSDQETATDDPGWVFHRKTNGEAFEGWLYHYADGAMVDEAGVVYEYPSADGHEDGSADEAPTPKAENPEPQPSTRGESRTESSRGESDGPEAVEGVAAASPALVEAAQEAHRLDDAGSDADHDSQEQADGAATDQTPAQEDAPQKDAAEEDDAEGNASEEDRAEAASSDHEHPEGASAEAEDRTADESTSSGSEPNDESAGTETTDRDAGDEDTPDADRTDTNDEDTGTTDRADKHDQGEDTEEKGADAGARDEGTDADDSTATTDDEASEDKTDEQDAQEETAENEDSNPRTQDGDPEDTTAENEDSNRKTDDDEDEDAPLPEVEDAGPMSGVTESVTGAWLNEKAEGKQTLPPEQEEAGEERAAQEDAESVQVPRFIEYSPSNLLRYVSGGLFAISSIAAVMTIFYAMQAASAAYMVLGGVFIVIALVAVWVLLSWEPTVVSIREGILEVAKGPHGDQVDLRDPRTKVDVGDNVGSPLWRMKVQRAGDKDLTIRAGQVKARQFAAIVQHHLDHPRKKPADDSED